MKPLRLSLGSFRVALVIFLTSCSALPDNGAVRIDLSSLYKHDALTGRTATTRVPIDSLRYVLLANSQVVSTGDITLDDSDSFTVEARVGTNLQLAVLGMSGLTSKVPSLAYLGHVKNIEVSAGKETTVTIPFYPAGTVNLSLDLQVSTKLAATDLLPEKCLLTATRTEPLDGEPWTESLMASFTSFQAPALAEDDPSAIFGNNVLPLPTGTYTMSCTTLWGGQKVELLGGQSLTVTQNTVQPFNARVQLGAPVVTPPILAPAGRYFDLSTFEGTTRQTNLLANGALAARVVGVARTLDGRVDTTFVGRLRMRFIPIYTDANATAPVVFVKNLPATNTEFEIEVREGTNGRFEVPLGANGAFAGLVQVVELSAATQAPLEHNQGMALFRVDVGSTEADRCRPVALSALALSEASFTHPVITYTENNQLGVMLDPNGAPRGLDNHLFVGILAQNIAQAGWCALDRILDTDASAQFPGLTLGVSTSQAGIFDFVEYLNPFMQPFFEPLLTLAGEDSANIPLFRLADGQVFLPNAIRATAELVKFPGLALSMNAYYRADAGTNGTSAGNKAITVGAVSGTTGGGP
jgi:hypothetical protein